MLNNVADLVHLAALNHSAWAGHPANGCLQCFTAIEHVHSWYLEIDSPLLQILQQLFDHERHPLMDALF